MQNLIKGILLEMGENPDREGLLKTPERVQEMYQYLTKGYREDPRKLINDAITAHVEALEREKKVPSGT